MEKVRIFQELEERAKPLICLLKEKYDMNTTIIVSIDNVKVVSDDVSIPIKVD